MATYDPERLAAELSAEDLRLRRDTALERVEIRVERAQNDSRDLTRRETDLSHADKAEVEAVDDALALRRMMDERGEKGRRALEELARMRGEAETREGGTSPFFPSAANMEILARSWQRMEPVTVLERAATAEMGTGTEYAPSGLAAPRSLWRSAGIPTHAADGLHANVPTFTLPAGVAPVGEGTSHAEFSGVSPSVVTLGRVGAFSSLTSEALLSTNVEELSQAHARILARDADVVAVTAIELTAVVTPLDQAILEVADDAGRDVTDLWILGTAADLAPIVGGAARTAASGGDTESFAVRYAGARVYVTAAATATSVTVFDPGSFKAVASGLASQLVHDPTNGAQTFGQWFHIAIAPTLVGGAVTVTV